VKLATELFTAYIEYKAKHQRYVVKHAAELGVNLNPSDVICLNYLLWLEVSHVAQAIKSEFIERNIFAPLDRPIRLKGMYGVIIKRSPYVAMITQI
jgi:hypothetical protein